MNTILDAALGYHARGWCIIPVAGKRAVTKWQRFQTERPTEVELHRSFRRKGITGLAVMLGDVSGGLVCRDYDILDSYERWAGSHGDVASTLPTVQTARGRHVYFRNGARQTIHQTDGELRAGCNYCLLPPSVHPSGAPYRWHVPLPAGELPYIVDPAAVGLTRDCYGEYREYREHRSNGGGVGKGQGASPAAAPAT